MIDINIGQVELKMGINNYCIGIGTCQKYYNTRMKILSDTLLKTLNPNNTIIFSDTNKQFFGWKTQLSQGKDWGGMNNFPIKWFLNSDYDYYILSCDDTYFQIDMVESLLLKYKDIQYLYAGFPLYHLNNYHPFMKQYLSGGNIRIFNKKMIKSIQKYLNINYYRKLPFIKPNLPSYYCQDVLIGIVAALEGIQSINIFSEEAKCTYTTCCTFQETINIINNHPQPAYHFIDIGHKQVTDAYKLRFMERICNLLYNKYNKRCFQNKNNLLDY